MAVSKWQRRYSCSGAMVVMRQMLSFLRAICSRIAEGEAAMFTIRHIHIGGEENLARVNSIRFTPGTDRHGLQGQSGTPPTLWITDSDHFDERPVTGGTVFVMNENGKTVARYDLGASPVPIVGDGLTDPRPKGLGEP